MLKTGVLPDDKESFMPVSAYWCVGLLMSFLLLLAIAESLACRWRKANAELLKRQRMVEFETKTAHEDNEGGIPEEHIGTFVYCFYFVSSRWCHYFDGVDGMSSLRV